MKILLVEGEPKLASFVKKGFENEGYDFSVAFDGRMGLSLVQQGYYDLVILDVNLPHINGFELCRLIRADYPQLPVLLLTALDSLDDKVTGFEAGADDYLVKPFEFKELLLRARVLTRRSSEATAVKRVLQLADLELNLDTKAVTRAVDISNDLYRASYANYLEVVTAQRSVLDAELSLTDARRQQFMLFVDLYRALGGGWEAAGQP